MRITRYLAHMDGTHHACRSMSFQDTSGRIVAYDLVSGSMLGVLALGDTTAADDDKQGEEGPAVVTTETTQGAADGAAISWAGRGDCLAVYVSTPEVIGRQGRSNKCSSIFFNLEISKPWTFNFTFVR